MTALETTNQKPELIMDHTFELIKRATSEDKMLSHLIPCIMHGWPDEKSKLPFDLTAYWNFRSELITVDGVICKGNKVLILSLMHPRMVEKNPLLYPNQISCYLLLYNHSEQMVSTKLIALCAERLYYIVIQR